MSEFTINPLRSPLSVRPVDEIGKFPNRKEENKKKKKGDNRGNSDFYKDPFLGNKLDVKA